MPRYAQGRSCAEVGSHYYTGGTCGPFHKADTMVMLPANIDDGNGNGTAFFDLGIVSCTFLHDLWLRIFFPIWNWKGTLTGLLARACRRTPHPHPVPV